MAPPKAKAPATRGRGRPSKYHDKVPEQARKLCIAGWTDAQMAAFFEVAMSTFSLWKVEHPEFSEALKAKATADAEVEASLFQRAIGYSHPDVHISNYQGLVTVTPITKHYPPDPTSMIFWLKNRQPARWREKVEVGGDEEAPLPVKVVVQVQDASAGDADPQPAAG